MKIDKFLRRDSDKGEVKKSFVVATIIIGVLVACCFGVGYFVYYLSDYFDDNKEITNLYDFYDLKVGVNTNAIYFIGGSYVAESVYPPEINKILKERGYGDYTVYTTYVSSECPLDRLVHLQKLIESKPTIVIYGMTASALSKNTITEDNVLIVKNRLNLLDGISQFYTDDELNMIYGIPDISDYNKFLDSAKRYNKNPVRLFEIDYSIDPLGGEYARTYIWGANANKDALNYLYNPDYVINYQLSETSRTVEAFNYILQTLEEENIDVVVVNAPINPLVSDRISTESREEYFSLLDDTGYDWYDFEYRISDEYFFDTVHTTFAGAMELAPMWAEMIIQELS